MCILIVEDDPTSAKVIETNLNKNGYETTTAASGKQALQYLADQEFELILIDVMIPEIGGLEVLIKIKDHADQKKSHCLCVRLRRLNKLPLGNQKYR